MKRVSTLIAAVWMLAVAGCADIPQQSAPPVVKSAPVIVPEPVVQRPAPVQRAANPNAVSEALLPPLVVEMPRSDIAPPDTRFDLNVNNAPANQVFMAIDHRIFRAKSGRKCQRTKKRRNVRSSESFSRPPEQWTGKARRMDPLLPRMAHPRPRQKFMSRVPSGHERSIVLAVHHGEVIRSARNAMFP